MSGSTSPVVPVSPARRRPGRRLWFGLDAVVTGTNGLAYLALAPTLAGVLGADATLHRQVGVFLTCFAVVVGVVATTPPPRRRRLATAVVVVNVGWVLASLLVAAIGLLDLSVIGRAWAAAQGVLVGLLALQQARSLRTD